MKIKLLIHSLSKNERRILVGAILIFLISSILWSIEVFYQKTTIRPVEGGAYNEGLIGQPIAINPLIAANDIDRDIIELVYSGLLDLTENYKTSDDQKIWTLTLKKNLRWSDDQPITADDVLFTLATIKDSETRSPLFSAWQGVIGERLSEYQLRLILRTPYAFFSDSLKNFKVTPQHIFESIPTANLRLSSYNLEPVSSGPFKFAGYAKRKDGFITKYRLVRNKNYAGEKPLIKEFNLNFYLNKEGLLDAFNSRKIDGLGGIDYQDIEKIKTSRQIFQMNIPGYYAIFFNSALHPALKEKSVRKALNYAVDKNKIVNSVFANNANIINSPIVPGIEGYEPEIYKEEMPSLEKATKELDNAKWSLNKDGLKTKSIDKKEVGLEFDIVVPQVDFLVKTADLIKADLETIGIKLNPIVMRPSEIQNEIIKTRNYQMLIFGTILKNNPDVFSFWHSSERFYPGNNLALFSNKNADAILETIKTDFNPESRKSNLSKFQSIIAAEQPAIFLFSPFYFYVANKNLGGFDVKFLATRSSRFDNVKSWYLKTARVFK